MKCNECQNFSKQKERLLRKENTDLDIYYKVVREHESHKKKHYEEAMN